MMIFSAKITKAKLLTLALICSCIALIVIVSIPRGDDVPTLKTTYEGKTNDQRVSFLENFGWNVGAEPKASAEVVIPETFDSTYGAYNDLQKTQGFDLEPYRGLKATRYTYGVLNYPNAKTGEEIEANLLVVGGEIVAGDVTSTALGGFMQGLAKPAVSSSEVEDYTKPVINPDPMGK